MRFIHAADIHLGSKLSGKLPEAKSRIRKDELRASFSRLVEYAKQQEIKAILLSGDVFDDDAPNSKDVTYFYSVVDAHPGIDFYYLRGNHDRSGALAEERPNLHRFGENWTSYELEPGVILTGIEFSQENSLSLYATLQLDPKAKNVVTLHGQVSSSTGPYEINLPKLRDKHIDYLALGHVHKKEVGKLDLRGTYAYPGCLEGRGYDEIGEKGFFLVDTDLPFDKGGLTFVPFASRAIRLLEVDISDCKDSYEAIQKIRKARSVTTGSISRRSARRDPGRRRTSSASKSPGRKPGKTIPWPTRSNSPSKRTPSSSLPRTEPSPRSISPPIWIRRPSAASSSGASWPPPTTKRPKSASSARAYPP